MNFSDSIFCFVSFFFFLQVTKFAHAEFLNPILSKGEQPTFPLPNYEEYLDNESYKSINSLSKTSSTISTTSNAKPNSLLCSGPCCSSKAKSIKKGEATMPSRWFTNALYDKSRVHIWTVTGAWWGSAVNKTTKWSSKITAFIPYQVMPASTYITLSRPTSDTVQFQVPGGGYIEARPDGFLYVASKPSIRTRFKFTRVGSKQLFLRTYLGTYVTWDTSRYLVHWPKVPGLWETFSIYEVMEVPAYRGVNLGGWLMAESWMNPSLFKDLPILVDGTQVQFQAINSRTWMSAKGNQVRCNAKIAGLNETFHIRRLGKTNGGLFQFMTKARFFLSSAKTNLIALDQTSAGSDETFTLYASKSNSSIYLIQANNKKFLSCKNGILSFDTDASRVPLTKEASWKGANAFYMKVTFPQRTQWQLFHYLGQKKAMSRMEKHWKTFIQEKDFAYLKSMGLNSVRIPICYWLTQQNKPDYPYIPGSLKYLDWAFAMAKKYGLKILVSMHSAPESANGADSRDGFGHWGIKNQNVSKMLDAVEFIAKRYANHPAFSGIGVLNEPGNQIPYEQVLIPYYYDALSRIRKYSQCAHMATTPGAGYSYWRIPGWPDKGNNVILDDHFYPVFNPQSWGKPASYVVNNLVYKQSEKWIKEIQSTGHWQHMIGEWSVSLYTHTTQAGYALFGKSQLEVYSKTDSGWFFWAYKVEKPTVWPNWDWRESIKRRWLARKNKSWSYL